MSTPADDSIPVALLRGPPYIMYEELPVLWTYPDDPMTYCTSCSPGKVKQRFDWDLVWLSHRCSGCHKELHGGKPWSPKYSYEKMDEDLPKAQQAKFNT
jgi:hypothetical protein